MSPLPPPPAPPNEVVLVAAPPPGTRAVTVILAVLPLVALVLLVARALGWFVIVMMAAAGLALWRGREIATGFRWYPAELVVPNVPLALGAHLRPVYRRRPRRLHDLADAAVEATLICREVATYKAGTDTRTVTHDAVRQTSTARGGGTPRGFEAGVELTIPVDRGCPTMTLPNNRVHWLLSTRMQGRGLPDDEQIFTLTVSPVLDPSIRAAPPVDDRFDDRLDDRYDP